MKLTAQQALLAAAQVFEDYPDRWTTNVYARKKGGVATNPGSPTAYCFCAEGSEFVIAMFRKAAE